MTEVDRYFVIDTEGSPLLREIAVFDHHGKLIYEAFSTESPVQGRRRLHDKPLARILEDLTALVSDQTLVCHYAQHDRQVLAHSFHHVGCPSPFRLKCTWELAQTCFPNLPSYSLKYLCRYLQIRGHGKIFHSDHHHSARYDAEFTYYLYARIMKHQDMVNRLQTTPNPFSSNRVDNPFQDHLDLRSVYHTEYETLKSVILDIKQDPNQQSRGAIVIGEPGSGKTHLMMRLAKEVLATNRLLFIRQPNHPQAVLHHAYSRILESLAEKIPGSEFTQLEQLLSNSFVRILEQIPSVRNAEKGQAILKVLKENSLYLYHNIPAQKRLDVWDYIDRNITRWWTERYTAAGYSQDILKGIIKFCGYTDASKKSKVRRWLAAGGLSEEDIADIGLEDWHENMGKEEFSLEGITTFGKLSTLDEPLIIIFDQLEGLADKPALLESFGHAVKEILTHVPNSLVILTLFPDRWQQFRHVFDGSVVDRISQHEVHLQIPDQAQLHDILRQKAATVDLDLDTLFGPREIQDILAQPSIRAMLNRAAAYYRALAQNIPLPPSQPDPPVLFDKSMDARLQRLEQEFTRVKQALLTLSSLFQPLAVTKDVSIPSTPVPDQDLAVTAPGPEQRPAVPVFTIPSAALSTDPDQLVLDFLTAQQKQIEKDYHRALILADSDELGKLLEIINAFQKIQSIVVDQLSLGKRVLPEHIKIDVNRSSHVIGFLNLSGAAFAPRIKNFNQLVVSNPKTQFHLIRDAREPQIKGAVSLKEIEWLNQTENGSFRIMEKAERIQFELAYTLIVAVQNRDLEVEMAEALQVLVNQQPQDWLLQLLRPAARSN
ncbi:MAG: exonuclease [Synechococcaceae cyanobacterium SM2_3_1]|nr:exonuclease [Synechococcaceae cyanobacterium SM2_3_1]